MASSVVHGSPALRPHPAAHYPPATVSGGPLAMLAAPAPVPAAGPHGHGHAQCHGPVHAGIVAPGIPTTVHGHYVTGLPRILETGVLRDPAHSPLLRCGRQTVHTLGYAVLNPDTAAEVYGTGEVTWPQ